MLELWGRKNSSNVMAVTWALDEVGQDYVRHNLGGSFGGLDTAEYGRLNPNRVVPTLVDNGEALWESNAIVRYLAAQYGRGTLMPGDAIQAARADQWMEWVKTTLYGVFQPVFFGLVRMPPEKRDQAQIDRNIPLSGKILGIVDQHLGSNQYMAGEAFSMGDIPLGTLMYRYFTMDIDRPALPNVQAWLGRMQEREAYQHNVMLPFGNSPEEWLALERADLA